MRNRKSPSSRRKDANATGDTRSSPPWKSRFAIVALCLLVSGGISIPLVVSAIPRSLSDWHPLFICLLVFVYFFIFTPNILVSRGHLRAGIRLLKAVSSLSVLIASSSLVFMRSGEQLSLLLASISIASGLVSYRTLCGTKYQELARFCEEQWERYRRAEKVLAERPFKMNGKFIRARTGNSIIQKLDSPWGIVVVYPVGFIAVVAVGGLLISQI